MKYRCEFEIPDGDFKAKLDAMANAGRNENMWREIHSKQEFMHLTSLKGKCGSCKYFQPIERICGGKSYGNCEKGYVTRPRTSPICKSFFEEKK